MKRKMILTKISKLLMKKATPQMRISIISFVLSVSVLTICLSVIYKQIESINDNFINNENTHIIEVSGKYSNDTYNSIDIRFVEELTQLVNEYNCDVFSIYQFRYGINANELDEQINLYSVDRNGERYILKDNEDMQSNIMYTDMKYTSNTITLLLPQVSIERDGISLFEESPMELRVQNAVFSEGINLYSAFDEEMCFVSYDTFKSMYKMCYGEEITEESLRRIKAAEPIYKVFIYVDDISDVDKVAKLVNKNDFLTNFVFKSFDDIGESLSKSIIVMFIASVILIIFTIFNLVMAINNYIKGSSKDIGILKQMGYSKKELLKIYGNIVDKIVISISAVSVAVIILIFILIIGLDNIKIGFLYLFAFGCVILAIDVLIKQFFVRCIVNKKVMDLVKNNRSFE